MLLQSVILKYELSQGEVNAITEAVLMDSGLVALASALDNRFSEEQAFAIGAAISEAVLHEPIAEVAPMTSVARKQKNEELISKWMVEKAEAQERKRQAAAREDAVLYAMERLGVISSDEQDLDEIYLAMAG